jgi:hypothetical protein
MQSIQYVQISHAVFETAKFKHANIHKRHELLSSKVRRVSLFLAILFLPYRSIRLLFWATSFLLRLFQLQGFETGPGSYSTGPLERRYGSRKLSVPPPPPSGYYILRSTSQEKLESQPHTTDHVAQICSWQVCGMAKWLTQAVELPSQ